MAKITVATVMTTITVKKTLNAIHATLVQSIGAKTNPVTIMAVNRNSAILEICPCQSLYGMNSSFLEIGLAKTVEPVNNEDCDETEHDRDCNQCFHGPSMIECKCNALKPYLLAQDKSGKPIRP